ncbi:MAG TPA: hypothetical protein VGE07_10720, partial [Herpetosiphonaceae bacterium]
ALALGGLALAAPLLLFQLRALVSDTPSLRLAASAAMLRERAPADQPLLAYEPLYNLLSDRPFATAPDGRLFVDPFMHVRGLATAWDASAWADAKRLLLDGQAPPANPADAIEAMLRQAPLAVFDANRPPTALAQRLLLASEFNQWPLDRATLYERIPEPRIYAAESVQVRGMLLPRRAEAGATLPVMVYWQLLRAESRAPWLSIQLVDAENRKWGQVDKPVGPEGAPFWAWDAGAKIYEEAIAVPIDPATPPGAYQLVFVIYDPATGERWPFVRPDGAPAGDALYPERVEIAAPAR